MTGETLEILTYWYWVKVPRAPIIITAATLQLLILTETARSRMGPWGGGVTVQAEGGAPGPPSQGCITPLMSQLHDKPTNEPIR